MGMSVSHASWRWSQTVTNAALLFLAFVVLMAGALSSGAGSNGAAVGSPTVKAGPLTALAAAHPAKRVEVIVQLQRGTDRATGRELIRSAGGKVTRDLRIINGLGARMTAGAAAQLQGAAGVRAVSLNARVEKSGTVDPDQLATSYNASIRSSKAWTAGYTGKGVGVALIDTGIAGDLPDFRVSQTDPTSRVIATAVTNPDATTARDVYGHGTHVAGLIAGNSVGYGGTALSGRYMGVAPKANLVSVKVSDDSGDTTVLDVIYGVQFAVDHRDDMGIRVVNLSLSSSAAESYKTDPLDAAAEAAWFAGIVVVAAAGNDGSNSDAVSFAPGNDPFVITAGALDDKGTSILTDDSVAPWSSRGVTQDGFAKPDVLAPGNKLVAPLAPTSSFPTLCRSCKVGRTYFRLSGTSMATAVVSGTVALMVQNKPGLTPNQVKGTLVASGRKVTGAVAPAVDANAALDAQGTANAGLTPNSLIDPSTRTIDWARASFRRASFRDALGSPFSALWTRASFRCDCGLDGSGEVDSARASFRRVSFRRVYDF
jgi:serine protease AprX